MDDQSILSRIEKLVAEEHSLQGGEQSDAASEQALDADRERLERVSVELDRCWDLLRQRRAPTRRRRGSRRRAGARRGHRREIPAVAAPDAPAAVARLPL